jgi:hypothetical protein
MENCLQCVGWLYVCLVPERPPAGFQDDVPRGGPFAQYNPGKHWKTKFFKRLGLTLENKVRKQSRNVRANALKVKKN